jgi:hypothetical protein
MLAAAEIVSYPSGLKVDDIEDMVILAKYYATRTPQSFRWVSRSLFDVIIAKYDEFVLIL